MFIRILYGGTFKTWLKDNGFSEHNITSETGAFITEYEKDAQIVINAISNDNPKYVEYFRNKGKHNPNASTASLYFQHMEHKVLETIFNSLVKANMISKVQGSGRNIYNCVLCFDGIMIPKNNLPEETLKAHLTKLEESIKTRLHLSLKLEIKPQTEGYSVDTLLSKTDNLNEPEVRPVSRFNVKTALSRIPDLSSIQEELDKIDPKNKREVKKITSKGDIISYNAIKEYFEDHFIYLTDNNAILNIRPETTELYKASSSDLQITFCPLKLMSGCPFFKKWLDDPDKRSYSTTDFFPPPMRTQTGIFNTFREFSIQSVPYTKPKCPKLYKQHIQLLTGNDTEGTEYILNYLAHLVQKPGERPLVALLFKSRQGVGKNLFFGKIGSRLLGEHYYKEIETLDSIFGNFTSIQNQLLVVIDELSGKEAFSQNNRIKQLVTSEKIKVNEKYKPTYSTNNFGRYVFFSNENTPVKIELSDRRFVAFESDPSRCGDSK